MNAKWSENEGGMGVVTGSDTNGEWMLPWWLTSFRKHNSYPVCFADFGMSDTSKRWCSENGKILDLTWQFSPPRLNWFKKSYAILACPFDTIVWIDSDCEVLGNINDIFNYANQGLAVTIDKHNRWVKHKNGVQSGVVGVKHGNDIITKWADACATTSQRGDQECLNNDILKDNRNGVIIMPQKYQHLRLDGPSQPDTIIYHFTGPAGKKIIKSKCI